MKKHILLLLVFMMITGFSISYAATHCTLVNADAETGFITVIDKNRSMEVYLDGIYPDKVLIKEDFFEYISRWTEGKRLSYSFVGKYNGKSTINLYANGVLLNGAIKKWTTQAFPRVN